MLHILFASYIMFRILSDAVFTVMDFFLLRKASVHVNIAALFVLSYRLVERVAGCYCHHAVFLCPFPPLLIC